jgi:hypothetical protein
MVLNHKFFEGKLMYLVQYSPDHGKTLSSRWENSADLLCIDKIRDYYMKPPSKRGLSKFQANEPVNGRRPRELTIHGLVDNTRKPLFIVEFSDSPGVLDIATPENLQGEFMNELIDYCWQHVGG